MNKKNLAIYSQSGLTSFFLFFNLEGLDPEPVMFVLRYNNNR